MLVSAIFVWCPQLKKVLLRKKFVLAVSKHSVGIFPVPHGVGLQIPKAPKSFIVESSEEEPQEACSNEPIPFHNPDYIPSTSAELYLIMYGIE